MHVRSSEVYGYNVHRCFWSWLGLEIYDGTIGIKVNDFRTRVYIPKAVIRLNSDYCYYSNTNLRRENAWGIKRKYIPNSKLLLKHSKLYGNL